MTPDVPTLEDRARRAAAGVKEAVDTADLQLFAAGIPALRTPETSPRGFRGFDRWIAAAGAFAAILIVVGLALLPGRLFAPDNDTATPQTTLPDSTVSSVVPDPDGEETVVTDAEPETTTSTTEAAETPTTIAVDTMPPELAITSPSDGATVTKGTIQFRGTTEPGARVIAAGQWEADVDAEGNWEIILGVSSGSNIATFTAIDEAGNETTAQVTVSYDPPSPTTTTSTTCPRRNRATAKARRSSSRSWHSSKRARRALRSMCTGARRRPATRSRSVRNTVRVRSLRMRPVTGSCAWSFLKHRMAKNSS